MYESYAELYKGDELIIKPGEAAEFSLMLEENDVKNRAFRLFFKGETKVFYYFKNEAECTLFYHSIDDALDYKNSSCNAYCLNLSCKEPLSYVKAARNKIVFPCKLAYLPLKANTDDWKAGVFVKTKNLQISGYVRMIFEIRYVHEDTMNNNCFIKPDEVKIINIEQGTYDFKEYSIALKLPADRIASVVVYIEGENYKGDLFFENPFLLSSNGYNVLPDFAPFYGYDKMKWIGLNLSRKEWPEFEISVNSEVFYSGELFERCHRYSDIEKNIPQGLLRTGENKIAVKLISDYREALPFAIVEAGIFSYPDDELTVVGMMRDAVEGENINILVKTKKPNMTVDFYCPSGKITGDSQKFYRAGYNVFKAMPVSKGNDVKFMLKSGSCEHNLNVRQIAFKEADNVYVSSGDMVYINQNEIEDVEAYISWYIANNVGNALTVRPCYRWSGGRTLNASAWEFVVNVLNGMNIKYAHMIDGRELPGIDANPDYKMLDGEDFLGRQRHELDGAYAYWDFREIKSFSGLQAAEWSFKLLGSTNQRMYTFDDNTVYMYRSPKNQTRDMRTAAENLVNNLSLMKNDASRHTGPSTLFKYFAQAGYTVLGAEIMYGPTETVLAFLRGTAYGYNLENITTHLAMQWSTAPHDNEDHYRRFRLALYISYMQGINQINTEEGLWHIEEYYNSFSRNGQCCLSHLKQQQDFVRYVNTHSRSGKYYVSSAFVSGRYDAFRSFGGDNVFGTLMEEADAEKSWELMRIFYPGNKATSIIYEYFPPKEPLGYYSGTPMGNVDVLPIESDIDKFSYKSMFFVGYNKAEPEDMDKLYSYVKAGGVIVMGLPHLSVATDRDAVESSNHTFINHEFTEQIFDSSLPLLSDTFKGTQIKMFEKIKYGEVMEVSDSGYPLLIKILMGKGVVWFINANLYPGENAVKEIYENTIRNIVSENNSKETSFILCGDDIQFTVYDKPNGERHFYLLAVDWYNSSAKNRSAILRLGSKEYEVEVPVDTLIKIVVKDNCAAWAETENGEVISFCDNMFSVQGYGINVFHIIKDDNVKKETVDFKNKHRQTL
ncbi:MAG: hypothetical protein J6N52_01450 [Clostridia bacterium]|nr:hypothetical protein [Clostridia bacterium]